MKALVALVAWLACVAAVVEHRALHIGGTGVFMFTVGGIWLFLAMLKHLSD